MSQSTKKRWNSGPACSTPSSTSKKKKYYCKFQDEWKKSHHWLQIWRFALCVVPTSVLLQGDCMILRDTQRPVSNADPDSPERIFFNVRKNTN